MTPISRGRNPSLDGETTASGTALNQSPNTANVRFCSLWAPARSLPGRAGPVRLVPLYSTTSPASLHGGAKAPLALTNHGHTSIHRNLRNQGSGFRRALIPDSLFPIPLYIAQVRAGISGRSVQAEKIDEPGCPARACSQPAVYGATNVLTIQGEIRPQRADIQR